MQETHRRDSAQHESKQHLCSCWCSQSNRQPPNKQGVWLRATRAQKRSTTTLKHGAVMMLLLCMYNKSKSKSQILLFKIRSATCVSSKTFVHTNERGVCNCLPNSANTPLYPPLCVSYPASELSPAKHALRALLFHKNTTAPPHQFSI